MNAYRDYMEYAGTVPAHANAGWAGVQRLVALVGRHLHRARLRRELWQLDHLDDWILKDIGLFRDRLPGGGTRIRRR